MQTMSEHEFHGLRNKLTFARLWRTLSVSTDHVRRRRIVGFALLVTLLVVAIVQSPATATHTFTRIIDDDCGHLRPTPPGALFFGEGPDQWWYRATPVTNAHGQCYLWTTTLDGNEGGAPVNRGWWYLHSQFDLTGTYYVQAYQPGTHNSCGNVFYNVMPQGDTGVNFQSWVSQLAGWSYVARATMYPAEGAKIYLGDKQFCTANSTITIELTHWDRDH